MNSPQETPTKKNTHTQPHQDLSMTHISKPQKEYENSIKTNQIKEEEEGMMLTVAVFDEVVEGVAVAVVGELVVAGRKLLKALSSDGCEISFEFGEFCNDYGAASDRSIDQRFLPHFLGFFFWLTTFGSSSCYFEFGGFLGLLFSPRSLAQSSFSF